MYDKCVSVLVLTAGTITVVELTIVYIIIVVIITQVDSLGVVVNVWRTGVECFYKER